MRVQPDQQNVPCPLPSNYLPLGTWCRRVGLLTWKFVAVLTCCGVVFSSGLNAADVALRGDSVPSPLSIDGGFTRESLQEFDAPEPAPFAAVPTVSIQEEDQPARYRHHRQVRHRQQVAQSQPQVVVVKAAPRRNPVESFVYWWNGWVVRTFHTRNGTVLLDKIGAKA